jgi:hypothetical protein
MFEFTGEPVGQLHVFDAFRVTAAAVSDDHVHIMRRDIAATNITVVIVFAVKWADVGSSHMLLI